MGVLLLVVADFGPSASAYHTTPAYFDPDEQRAYAWLAERSAVGRLLEPAESPRDQYLRAYSLSVAPLWRFAGYYDNGAPLYTWQQHAWTDLRTLLRLHHVRYAMLREDEPIAAEYLEQLQDAGFRVAFVAGRVIVLENPQVGGYAQLFHRSALDLSGNFFRSFEALPELVWREIAMVAADGLRAEQMVPEDFVRYDYLLVDDAGQSKAFAGDKAGAAWASLGGKYVTTADLVALELAPRPRDLTWTKRPAFDEICVEVRASAPGVLTIAESWYPHWRVRVDETPTEILRVNWALLGVHVPSGTHQVTFRYRRPLYVDAGYAISLLSAFALVAWWVRCLAAWLDRGEVVAEVDMGILVRSRGEDSVS